ncbi:MAG: penicillin-binding protein, partial [Pseudonocardia sp.]|nr:penicillin-binding protein [Pseudonocardia sp.]
GGPGPDGPRPPRAPSPDGRAPYHSGDMPLLTHEETGSESVARTNAVAMAELPPGDPHDRDTRADRMSAWRRVRRALYVLLGLVVLGPVLAFVVGWFVFEVPTSEEVAVEQVSRYTFADGSDLATVRPDGVNRQVVRLADIPLHVREAVLAAENRSFYTDPGFDITGIMRAAYNQLTGGVGGGSTITQQYVKVVTGNDDFTLVRKYKEVVLAVKISREQTKDEILENYLNVIYMGRGAYGIQAASQAFFAKDVGELTVSEGAMLAGMIQAPSRWDPAEDLEGSQRRWTYVLDQMRDAGFITPTQRAAEVFPTNWLKEAPPVEGIPADARAHIYKLARDEVLARGIVSEDELDTAGLTVTTTVDPARQREAADAVNTEMERQPESLRSALASIDPRTGAIVAYFGGPNGQGIDYAQALRQPGSSFKPFVLAAAMMADPELGLGSTYNGTSGQEFAGTVVRNSEGFDCVSCTVKTAMTRSINTIFYQLGLEAGPQRVIDAAHAAGIPEDLVTDPRGGIALGDQEVHPIDMASAYATFAAGGTYREPYVVSRVTAADGRVLYEREEDPGTPNAIPQQVARNVTESMLDVADVAGIALAGGRPVAGKTGTVQAAQDGQNKDAWMVGYTPSLSTAVWVGSDMSDPIKNAQGRPIYGSGVPGSIWQAFMNDALQGTEHEEFPEFEPLGRPPAAEFASSNSSDGSESTERNGDGNGGDDRDDRENRDNADENGTDGDNGNGTDGNGADGDGNGDPNNGDENPNGGDNGRDDRGDNGGDGSGDNSGDSSRDGGDNGDGSGDNTDGGDPDSGE